MNRKFPVIIAAIMSFLMTVVVIGQTNVKTVTKSVPPAGFSLPGPVQQVQPVLPLKNTAMYSVPAFVPRKINPAALSLDPSAFTAAKYDRDGRLLFAEGHVAGALPVASTTADQISPACYQYLDAIRKPLGIKTPDREFTVSDIQTDDLNMNHIRMQQVSNGLPVYGGDIYLHSRNGFIELFNGYAYPTPEIADYNPVVGSRQAVGNAVEHLGLQTVVRPLSDAEKELLKYTEPVSELVIYHKDRNPAMEKLAWHLTIRPNLIERWEYFIDATTGEVIHFFNNTQSDGDIVTSGTDLNGVNQTFHVYLEGGTYYLVDISKAMFNPQTFDGAIKTYDAFNAPYNQITNASIVASATNSWAANAISAHYHASLSYDYWKNTFNRNSWNGNGASIPSVINITGQNGEGFDNAFWNGQAIFYGNGNIFEPFPGSLDLSAHEFGHAVDETTANLEYQNQSGAINESYSDIIGCMVERRNWKIGEDIVPAGNPYFPTGAARDMSNPHNGGSSFSDMCYQPASMSEIYTGQEDNGGVHVNSGIGNFAYYKYATAVGLVKGEQTFMRALFNYLTRSSQYADFRIAVVQAATDLYGSGSAEVAAAAQAFAEVGIGEGGGGGGGGGTTEPGTLQVNPGQDYIFLLDTYTGDQNTLFMSNTAGTQFSAMSQTEIRNKPSIPDDGSVAVFISGDSKMRALDIASQSNERIIQNDAIWDGVSVSKNGTLLSAVTIYADSSIYVYSFEKAQWARFHLYNPGTQPGVVTYNVLYADAMEWLYDGEYIMYDAYSKLNGPQGQTIDYWDINFIRVCNKATNDWGDGQIFKLISGLDEGISIGNPALAKNSTYIAAFDRMNANTGTNDILAVNLDNGDVAQVYSNGTTMGTPNYSKFDDKIIFTVKNGSQEDIAVIPMQADKIHPAGNAASLIPEAKWGIWFAQGTRALATEEKVNDRVIRIYPNPGKGNLTIDVGEMTGERVLISVHDLQGRRVHTQETDFSDGRITLDLTHLGTGFYMITVAGKDYSLKSKIIIE
jgi:Zn-dependent metalloprotease